MYTKRYITCKVIWKYKFENSRAEHVRPVEHNCTSLICANYCGIYVRTRVTVVVFFLSFFIAFYCGRSTTAKSKNPYGFSDKDTLFGRYIRGRLTRETRFPRGPEKPRSLRRQTFRTSNWTLTARPNQIGYYLRTSVIDRNIIAFMPVSLFVPSERTCDVPANKTKRTADCHGPETNRNQSDSRRYYGTK